MKLIKAHVKNFRSIEDSNEFNISDLTCLVGKNEAGKTSLLQALYGVNPFKSYEYDKVRDYPRRFLNKFSDNHKDGNSEVIRTIWELENKEISKIEEQFCPGVLQGSVIEISSGINYEGNLWTISADTKKIISFLCDKHKLTADEAAVFSEIKETEQVLEIEKTTTDLTDNQKLLLADIKKYPSGDIVLALIDALSPMVPKFFYTSHFERMSGEISLQKLTQDKQNKTLSKGDEIFLDFLEYAGTSIEELQSVSRYEELKAQCEGASNEITEEIFEFWSQNEALSVKIELGEGKKDDPAPFNSGTISKIRIENQYHRATVPLSERSAGFVWFFSFLAQFKQLKKTTGNAIILLDEPGLTLHGKAQADLLRYIQDRLLPAHQVIYSTHSPFMVPTNRLADVRVVEDIIKFDERRRPIVFGTKVSSDILCVDKDTLFPLQGHLGYELTQSLFIGKNTLLVEGPSDILFLQSLSQALKSKSREGLSAAWTICPTGGIDKIHSFASLFGGNKLNIAVLCDIAHGDKKKVERLKESEILKADQVFTVADFTGKAESDVEDVFHPELYCSIVNSAFSVPNKNLITPAGLVASTPKTDRMVKQAENLFKLMPEEVKEFDHFTPADWLIRNPSILDTASKEVAETLDMAEKVFNTLNKLLDTKG